MSLHRETTCSVCGVEVIAEQYTSRTYEPWDLNAPHYCQNEDVIARLAASAALLQAVIATEPEPVAPALPEFTEPVATPRFGGVEL